MELLDQPLIKKYFGCQKRDCQIHSEVCEKLIPAFDILKAMQEPLRVGERYLFWHKNKVTEMIWGGYMADITESHAEHLRLPDQFQPSRMTFDCVVCPHCGQAMKAKEVNEHMKTLSPEVEAEIRQICAPKNCFGDDDNIVFNIDDLDRRIRALCQLVLGAKE